MTTAKITGFHHTAMRVADFEQCIAFYHAIGFTTARSWGNTPSRAAMLDAGDGNYIEVFEGGDKDTPSEARLIHFALRTPDCESAHAAALEAGASEKMAPKDVNIDSDQGELPVKISFVYAPSGEVIEFFQNELT